MNDTRYGHGHAGGGTQDQGERKDEGWQSRQGGSQARERGSVGEPRPSDGPRGDHRDEPPSQGTNTQGELAGVSEASRRTLEEERGQPDEAASSGTDQPPRMGGPLGPDPKHPHLPEGAQDADTRGSGAGGFDRGVNAKVVGAVHQGSKPEDA